jgi:hypothetical protein
MNVKSNESLEMTYTIDTSQTQGLLSFSDIKQTIEESVDGMNETAGKKIATLKSVKENKKNVTASIQITDINKMGDGSFFGTVKEYRKEDGPGLNNLVDAKDKKVKEKDIANDLQMVYFPMGGTEEYGIVTVTVTVPGSIKYITSGGEIEKGNVAVFEGQNPLVVFKKGGGFPFWLIIVAAIIVIAFVVMKKKPASSPATSPINVTPSFGAPAQAPIQAPAAPQPVEAPVEPAPVNDGTADTNDSTVDMQIP